MTTPRCLYSRNGNDNEWFRVKVFRKCFCAKTLSQFKETFVVARLIRFPRHHPSP
jgi:hypothetical protein